MKEYEVFATGRLIVAAHCEEDAIVAAENVLSECFLDYGIESIG